MKLVAIYNVFDGEELLERSIDQISAHCEAVFTLTQETSNFGQVYADGAQKCRTLQAQGKVNVLAHYEPDLSLPPIQNELNKRQFGVEIAKREGFTHFLLIDCDEFYLPKEFQRAREEIIESGWMSTVCPIQSYFKHPTLTLGLDNYFVPFIHALTPQTRLYHPQFPYQVDPTRSVQLSPNVKVHCFAPESLTMHHYTWVRKDIQRKVHNNTCRDYVLQQSSLMQDHEKATPGLHVPHFGKILSTCEDRFDLAPLVC